MGEAAYYFKLFYAERDQTEKELEGVKLFMLQGTKAYDFWQDHRHIKTDDFWVEFKEKFPAIMDYVEKTSFKLPDNNNGLAGILDFGSEDDVESNLFVGEDDNAYFIGYSAMVWHFANWEPMMIYMAEKFGAYSYGWVSDEEVDYFDLIHR